MIGNDKNDIFIVTKVVFFMDMPIIHLIFVCIIRVCMKQKWMQELIRFGVVGAIATLLHYGIYLFMQLYVDVNIAYTVGYMISFLLNFYLTSYFTFRVKPSWGKMFGMGISHGINFLLHICLLNLFLWFGISKTLAPVPVFCIAIPVNFLLVRFVFKYKK